MKYFKDTDNQLYVDPIVSNHKGLVEITYEEFEEIRTYVSPEQKVENNKATALALFNTLSNAPIEIHGDTWQVDKDKSLPAIERAVNVLLDDETIQWTVLDNTSVEASMRMLQEVLRAVVDRDDLLHTSFRAWKNGDMLEPWGGIDNE